MRSISWMAGIVLLVLFAGSCDVTQPAQLGSQTFSLQLAATGGQAEVFYVYETVEVDAMGNPTGDSFLSCWLSPVVTSPTSWPFEFIVEVSVLRAGQAQFELITAGEAASIPSWNLTDYDTTFNVPFPGSVPYPPPDNSGRLIPCPNDPAASCVIGGQGTTFMFVAATRTAKPSVNDQVVEAVRCVDQNPPVPDGCNRWSNDFKAGLCSLDYPGPSRISTDPGSMAGPPYPFSITLGKGDTVAITARRANAPAMLPTNAGAVLNANFSLGGAPVTVEGTTAETSAQSGFRFTYTTR